MHFNSSHQDEPITYHFNKSVSTIDTYVFLYTHINYNMSNNTTSLYQQRLVELLGLGQ